MWALRAFDFVFGMVRMGVLSRNIGSDAGGGESSRLPPGRGAGKRTDVFSENLKRKREALSFTSYFSLLFTLHTPH